MKRRVSSNDVAKQAGVSQSTVSLVLNGKMEARISEETRERVLEAARQLNYTRNTAARALITGRTQRIGILPITPQALLDYSEYYKQILSGAIEGASGCNHNLVLHVARYADWKACYNDILSGSTDGILLVGRHIHDPLTLALLDAQFPTVCISYQPEHKRFFSIDCDNEAGAYLVVNHLLEQGYRRIAFVCPDDINSWTVERRDFAQEALQKANVPGATFEILTLPEHEPGQKTQETFLRDYVRDHPQRSDALIFVDEGLSAAFLEYLKETTIRVPEDLGVVSFNSTTISIHSVPPMTSVYQPLHEISQTAVETVYRLIEGQDVAPGIRKLPVRLDVRASTLRKGK